MEEAFQRKKEEEEEEERIRRMRMCYNCGNPNCWLAKMYEIREKVSHKRRDTSKENVSVVSIACVGGQSSPARKFVDQNPDELVSEREMIKRQLLNGYKQTADDS